MNDAAVERTCQELPQGPRCNKVRVWQVYAWRKYEEPLYEVGNVVADDVELSSVYARCTSDEWSWIEMILIPRDAIVTVIAS